MKIRAAEKIVLTSPVCGIQKIQENRENNSNLIRDLEAQMSVIDQNLARTKSARGETLQQPSPFGVAANRAANMMTFGMMPERFSPLEGLIHGVGGASVADFKMQQAQIPKENAEDEVSASKTKKDLQEQIRDLQEKEKELISQQINEKQKLLAVTREEQRAARLAAEAGQEAVTNKLVRFGSADEGTKAALRQIQAIADAGGTLNYQQIGLANQYGIDAAQQARKQSLDSANLPENISMFRQTMDMQKGREERAQEAEAAPLVQEQSELAQSIPKLSEQMKQARDEFSQALEKAFDLADLVASNKAQLEDYGKQIEATKEEVPEMVVIISRHRPFGFFMLWKSLMESLAFRMNSGISADSFAICRSHSASRATCFLSEISRFILPTLEKHLHIKSMSERVIPRVLSCRHSGKSSTFFVASMLLTSLTPQACRCQPRQTVPRQVSKNPQPH